MRPNSWEDDLLKSPRGFSPEVLCPSPDRMEIEIDRVFQYSGGELDSYRKIDFLDAPFKNSSEPHLAVETDLHKESEKLASNEKSDGDSSYRQSEDFSQGNKREKRKIPLYFRNKKNKKGNKKIRKVHRLNWKRKGCLRDVSDRDDEQDRTKNLKSISKDVLALIKKMKPQDTLSNDELAKRIIDKISVDSRQDKNIRRRLYDAVNVLEAVGKVVKTGGGKLDGHNKKGSYTLIKPIMIKSQKFEEREQKMDEQSQMVDLEEIHQIEKRVEEKRRKLKDLQAKKQTLLALIRRNKRSSKPIRQRKDTRNIAIGQSGPHLQLQQKKETSKKNASVIQSDERIMFPLLGFEVCDDTKFFKTPQIFAYKGSLKDAYSQLELIDYITFNEKSEKKEKNPSFSKSNSSKIHVKNEKHNLEAAEIPLEAEKLRNNYS